MERFYGWLESCLLVIEENEAIIEDAREASVQWRSALAKKKVSAVTLASNYVTSLQALQDIKEERMARTKAKITELLRKSDYYNDLRVCYRQPSKSYADTLHRNKSTTKQ